MPIVRVFVALCLVVSLTWGYVHPTLAASPFSSRHLPFPTEQQQQGGKLLINKPTTRMSSLFKFQKARLAGTEGDADSTKETETKNMFLSYTTLAILLGTFVSNQWSRQALFYLCDFGPDADAFRHINVAIGFSKDSYAGW